MIDSEASTERINNLPISSIGVSAKEYVPHAGMQHEPLLLHQFSLLSSDLKQQSGQQFIRGARLKL